MWRRNARADWSEWGGTQVRVGGALVRVGGALARVGEHWSEWGEDPVIAVFVR